MNGHISNDRKIRTERYLNDNDNISAESQVVKASCRISSFSTIASLFATFGEFGPSPEPPTSTIEVSKKRQSGLVADFEKLGMEEKPEWRRMASMYAEVLKLEKAGPSRQRQALPDRKQPGAKYTDVEVAARQMYVMYGLESRAVTPYTKDLLMKLRDAVIEAAAHPTSENLRQASDVEDHIRCRADLRRIIDSNDVAISNGVASVLRLGVLARYGDYMMYEAKHLRETILASGAEGRQALFKTPSGDFKFFLGVFNDLKNDPDLNSKMSNACDTLGLDTDHVKVAFEAYSERNSIVHNGIVDLITKRDWHELGRVCDKDLKNLPRYIMNSTELQVMEKAVRRVRDKWVWYDDETQRYQPSSRALDLQQSDLEAARKKKEIQELIQAKGASKSKVLADASREECEEKRKSTKDNFDKLMQSIGQKTQEIKELEARNTELQAALAGKR